MLAIRSSLQSHAAASAAAVLGLLALLPASVWGQTTATVQRAPATGRIEFDYDRHLTPTLEVDLGQGMLSDASGLIEAALTGVVEGLVESAAGKESQAVTQSADYLKSIVPIIENVGSAVSEVRVRGYDKLENDADGSRAALIAHYQKKIVAAQWDDLIRVNDGRMSAIVCILRQEGALRGVFVVGSEGNNLILVNVVCDLSPEKVKIVTKQLSKLGMKLGLERELQKAMQSIHH